MIRFEKKLPKWIKRAVKKVEKISLKRNTCSMSTIKVIENGLKYVQMLTIPNRHLHVQS